MSYFFPGITRRIPVPDGTTITPARYGGGPFRVTEVTEECSSEGRYEAQFSGPQQTPNGKDHQTVTGGIKFGRAGWRDTDTTADIPEALRCHLVGEEALRALLAPLHHEHEGVRP